MSAGPHGHNVWGIDELSRVALERCDTAKCAVQTMGAMAEAQGYYSSAAGPESSPVYDDSAECLGVSDAAGNVWIFHVLTGPDHKGAIWAAQHLEDDHVRWVGRCGAREPHRRRRAAGGPFDGVWRRSRPRQRHPPPLLVANAQEGPGGVVARSDTEHGDGVGGRSARVAVSVGENDAENVVQRLLDAGSTIAVWDNKGWSPFDWARRHGHDDVVDLLVAAMIRAREAALRR